MASLKSFALLIVVQILIAECAKIDPKLDFGDDAELVQVKKELKGGKIKGLRVTVDTSELKESRSSGSDSTSSSESNEKKKTVGVRTDVTFEITSGEVNDTKSVTEKEVGKDDDNASIPLVPVFKGKPDRGGNRDLWSVRPLDNPTPPLARPAYRPVITDDRNRFGGDDKWNQVPIYEIWTTERYNRKHDQPVYHLRDPYGSFQKPQQNFIPYAVNQDRHRQHGPWQPCDCKEYPGPFIQPQQPSSNEHRKQVIDDKLERPFSKTT